MNIMSNIGNAATSVNDKVLAAGESRSGKLLKMYGPLTGIILAFVPIIGNHIDSVDRRREAQEAWERQSRVNTYFHGSNLVQRIEDGTEKPTPKGELWIPNQ